MTNINATVFSKKPGEGRVAALEAENTKLQDEINNVWRPKKQALDVKEQERNKKGAAAREKQIREKFEDVSARANAEEGLKSWQKKMEGLQVLAGKHNMVNTYVWDCNGGWHAEEQQFASSFEHNIGGNFERNWGVGAEADFEVASVGVEFEGMATFKMTQTTNKSDRRSSAMDLKVELKEVESGGITDQRDIPLVPGEKVSRYRFMTFFLEGAEQHWNDFFDTVVDPEWLQSNAEGARALRQTQAANANKTWRVFHRVTYVERPAMMGFGRTQSKVEADEIQELREQVTKFEEKSTKFMKSAVKALKITDVTFEEGKKE